MNQLISALNFNEKKEVSPLLKIFGDGAIAFAVAVVTSAGKILTDNLVAKKINKDEKSEDNEEA